MRIPNDYIQIFARGDTEQLLFIQQQIRNRTIEQVAGVKFTTRSQDVIHARAFSQNSTRCDEIDRRVCDKGLKIN